MADTINDRIEQAAIDGVQKVSVDGTTVEAMSIQDMIAADRYVSQKAASAQTHFGLRFAKLVTRVD